MTSLVASASVSNYQQRRSQCKQINSDLCENMASVLCMQESSVSARNEQNVCEKEEETKFIMKLNAAHC